MPVYEPRLLLVHLTLVQELHAQSMQNGYYFTNRDTYNDASLTTDLQTLISHFILFVMPAIKLLQNQQCVHRAIIASTMLPANGPIVENVLETSEGSQPDESLPSYCAAVLTLRSGFGGKSNRGRSYYSGISEDDSSNSRLIPGALTRLQSVGDQLLNYFGNAAGINPFVYCLFSRKLGSGESGGPPWDAGGIRVIRQCQARSVLGTQRHRKIGIGN